MNGRDEDLSTRDLLGDDPGKRRGDEAVRDDIPHGDDTRHDEDLRRDDERRTDEPEYQGSMTAGEDPDVVEADAPTRLFSEADSERYLEKWESVQATFVDDPRAAVEHADGLVAEVIRRLAETFSEERENLEGQWAGGGDVSTEDLRVALQRYRAFFRRLLEV